MSLVFSRSVLGYDLFKIMVVDHGWSLEHLFVLCIFIQILMKWFESRDSNPYVDVFTFEAGRRIDVMAC